MGYGPARDEEQSLLARLLFTIVMLLLTDAAWAADRVALVIGNGAYENVARLPNPANDARAIAAVLEGMDFEVIEGVDLDGHAMEQALRRFVSSMKNAKVVLFYYSGHGLQVGGKNYLIPVDARLEDEAALDFEAIDADKIFGYMSGPDRVALAFLDACRDNPFAKSLARSLGATRGSVERGLAVPETAGSGLFIGFSTAPNDVATDGADRNSPFTAAMIKHLPTPGLEINQVLTRVKADVRAATKERQRPWTNSDLTADLYLVPLATQVPIAATPPVDDTESVATVDPAIATGARSLLLEASDDGSTGAMPLSGTMVWGRGVDDAGMPTLVGDADIPARHLAAHLVLRKNADTSLPASHVIELTFAAPQDFVGGYIGGLAGVLLKDEELDQGVPLVGASAGGHESVEPRRGLGEGAGSGSRKVPPGGV